LVVLLTVLVADAVMFMVIFPFQHGLGKHGNHLSGLVATSRPMDKNGGFLVFEEQTA
jgi:hypothetical protein